MEEIERIKLEKRFNEIYFKWGSYNGEYRKPLKIKKNLTDEKFKELQRMADDLEKGLEDLIKKRSLINKLKKIKDAGVKASKRRLDLIFETERDCIVLFQLKQIISKRRNHTEGSKQAETLNKIVNISKNQQMPKEVSEAIKRMKEELSRLSDKNRLTNFEKELFKRDGDAFKKYKAIYEGVFKQLEDFYNARLDLILRVADNDNGAFKELKEELKEFSKKQYNFYKSRLKMKKKDMEAFIDEAIYLAACEWHKNKKLSVMQWVVGKVKRTLKEKRTADYEDKESFITLGDVSIEDINENELKSIDERIWPRQMARMVGVSAETLRNWDKAGIYKAQWQNVKGKLFRYYLKEDKAPLVRIKIEKAKLKAHMNPSTRQGFWRISEVAKMFNRSRRTLIRWEKDKKIPAIKKDRHGKIYFIDDLKAIYKYVQSNPPGKSKNSHQFDSQESDSLEPISSEFSLPAVIDKL